MHALLLRGAHNKSILGGVKSGVRLAQQGDVRLWPTGLTKVLCALIPRSPFCGPFTKWGLEILRSIHRLLCLSADADVDDITHFYKENVLRKC